MSQGLLEHLESELPAPTDDAHYLQLITFLDAVAKNTTNLNSLIRHVESGKGSHSKLGLPFAFAQDDYARFLNDLSPMLTWPNIAGLTRVIQEGALCQYIRQRILNADNTNCLGVRPVNNQPVFSFWNSLFTFVVNLFPFNRTKKVCDAIVELTGYQINSHYLDVCYFGYVAIKQKYIYNGISLTYILINEGGSALLQRLNLNQQLSNYHPYLPNAVLITTGLGINVAFDYVFQGGGVYSLGYLLGTGMGKVVEAAAVFVVGPWNNTYPNTSKVLVQFANDAGVHVGSQIAQGMLEYNFSSEKPNKNKEQSNQRDSNQQSGRQQHQQGQQQEQQRQQQQQQQQRQQQEQQRQRQDQQHQHNQKQQPKPKPKPAENPQHTILSNTVLCERSRDKCCALALKTLGFTAVNNKVSIRQIKQAHRKTVIPVHPDKCTTDQCAQQTVAAHNARNIIMSDICSGFVLK